MERQNQIREVTTFPSDCVPGAVLLGHSTSSSARIYEYAVAATVTTTSSDDDT